MILCPCLCCTPCHCFIKLVYKCMCFPLNKYYFHGCCTYPCVVFVSVRRAAVLGCG